MEFKESRFLKKNSILRLLGRDSGLRKPLFGKNFDFTAFGTGFRAQKAAF